MKELKRHKLRTDYGNETGDKIRTEHYVTYNHDYVKWLEDRLLKILIIGDVIKQSELVCPQCGKDKYLHPLIADEGLCICDVKQTGL